MSKTAVNPKDREYRKGDEMILTRDREDPVVVEIDRVTKTQIVVRDPRHPDDPKRSIRFEKEAWNTKMLAEGSALWSHSPVGGVRVSRFDSARLYDHSDDAWEELMRCRALCIEQDRARRDERERKRREAEERIAVELAEVRELCDGRLSTVTKLASRQPDGTRIYVLDVPVKTDLFERKRGWEIAVVRCKDVEEEDWEKFAIWREDHRGEEVTDESTESARRACTVRRVEYAVTWTHGESHSFPSCSCEKAANDEEALWEAVRRVHNSW